MFKELMPLIQNRPLSITVAVLSGGRIRVNVIPQSLENDGKINEKLNYSNKEKIAKIPERAITALTTPLSLTGTPEEIDCDLPRALTDFTESHMRLQNTLDQAREQISEAVKATEDRDKAKNKGKNTCGSQADKKQEAKPGPSELLPLWCTPAKPAETDTSARQAAESNAAGETHTA
jgi:PRTRC genetic system protein E